MTRDEFRKSLIDKGYILTEWPKIVGDEIIVLDEDGRDYGVFKTIFFAFGTRRRKAEEAVEDAMEKADSNGNFVDGYPQNAEFFAVFPDGKMIAVTVSTEWNPSFVTSTTEVTP